MTQREVDGDVTLENPIGATSATDDCPYLSGLTTVGGTLKLIGVVEDSARSRLAAVTTIGGNLHILYSNVELPSVTALSGGLMVDVLTAAASRIQMTALTSLGSLQIMSNQIDKGCVVDMPLLQTVNGQFKVNGGAYNITLPALQTISGAVTFDNCYTIYAMGAAFYFDALTTVGSWQVKNLPSSTHISATALQTVENNFDIYNNLSPVIIAGYGSLSRVGGQFLITSNANLQPGDAAALRDQVLSRQGIGGAITIQP